jgi:hypothetical protein
MSMCSRFSASLSVDFITGLPVSLTTEGNQVTNVMLVCDRLSKMKRIIPWDMSVESTANINMFSNYMVCPALLSQTGDHNSCLHFGRNSA